MTEKEELIELLLEATYKRKGGGSYCRGSIELGTGCRTCPSCLWEIRRQEILAKHSRIDGVIG